MFRIAFVLFAAIQAAPQDEVKDALAHAEALYYAARFNESIAVLTRIDDALKTEPARVQEKTNTKLRLALAHIGLNETAKAKSLLMDLYYLDSDYVLDAAQFSPKVIAVAADAKADQNKIRCQTALEDGRTFLQTGNTVALVGLLRSSRSKCSGLAALEPEAAESFYRAGVAAYKRGDFSAAMSSLETAVALSPEHDLALQYINLIESKNQLTKESRKTLSTLVDTWTRACPTGDAATLNALRGQISDVLPECPEPRKKEAPVAPAVTAGPVKDPTCLDMQTQLALTRLKTRVDPTLAPEIRTYFKNSADIKVRVKARISESGDVTVMGMMEGNPVINNVVGVAVSQWKFVPVRDKSGPRCVDTEIPMLIKMR